jgi:hypothetical protein
MGPPQRFVPTESPELFASAEPDNLTSAIAVRRDGDTAVRIDTPLMAFERVPWWMQPRTLALTAAIAIVASLGTIVRTRRRFHRDVTRSGVERLAARLQTLAALAWVASAAAFAIFAATSLADETTLIYGWPAWSLLIFSTAALVASVLTAAMMILLPGIWRDVEGAWSASRKAWFTATAMIFAVCATSLGAWGALQPWNP